MPRVRASQRIRYSKELNHVHGLTDHPSSAPGEPVVFGVMGEYKNAGECLATIRDAELPDDMKRKLACIEVKKQKDA